MANPLNAIIPADQTCWVQDPSSIPPGGSKASVTVKSGNGSTKHPSNSVDNASTFTIVATLPKLTSGGSTGSVTFVNGKITDYTAPT